MSTDPTPLRLAPVGPVAATAAPEALQFERADFARSPAASCAFCKQPANGEYYQVNGRIACASCRGQIDQAVSGGSGAARIVRALIAGFGAAIAGFLIFWSIRAATGYEFALVAILVGWMVGKAVRWGTANRGGRLYQVLAVILTYLAIASTYTPDIIRGLRDNPGEGSISQSAAANPDTSNAADTASAQEKTAKQTAPAKKPVPFVYEVIAAFVISLAAPFLAGVSNIIGWIIIAVGLMQAWRLTRRVHVEISGPYRTVAAAI